MKKPILLILFLCIVSCSYFRSNPYAHLTIDDWANIPEDVKSAEFTKSIKQAQEYLDISAGSRQATQERKFQELALAELEYALSIYPKDIKAAIMKKQIEKHMGINSTADIKNP